MARQANELFYKEGTETMRVMKLTENGRKLRNILEVLTDLMVTATAFTAEEVLNLEHEYEFTGEDAIAAQRIHLELDAMTDPENYLDKETQSLLQLLYKIMEQVHAAQQ